MYPANEEFTDLMSVAFLNAMNDTNMLIPTGIGSTLLFPSDRISIQLGGDAAIVGSNKTIALPLNLPTSLITIGRPYGTEHGYVGADSYVDILAYIPFSVWTMTAATQDDIQQRLEFARQHRQNVFSSYGLNICVANIVVRGRPRIPSPITGLFVVDYQWEFFYRRT